MLSEEEISADRLIEEHSARKALSQDKEQREKEERWQSRGEKRQRKRKSRKMREKGKANISAIVMRSQRRDAKTPACGTGVICVILGTVTSGKTDEGWS